MKNKYILILGIVFALSVLVVAQINTGSGNQGSAGLNLSHFENQTWGNCLIIEPIEVSYSLQVIPLRQEVNYTGSFSFGRECVQGFAGVNGSDIVVSYVGSNFISALRESVREKYQEGLNKGTKRESGRNTISGGFTG